MTTIRSLNEAAYQDGKVSNLMFRDQAMLAGLDVDDPAVCERHLADLISRIDAAVDEATTRADLQKLMTERDLLPSFGWLQKLAPETLQPVLEKSRAKFA